jgi:hypothetical protein
VSQQHHHCSREFLSSRSSVVLSSRHVTLMATNSSRLRAAGSCDACNKGGIQVPSEMVTVHTCSVTGRLLSYGQLTCGEARVGEDEQQQAQAQNMMAL